MTLLAATSRSPPPDGVDVVPDAHRGRPRREALAAHDADVILMAAAVADYQPAERIEGKRPKDGEPWIVELVPTADVATALGAIRKPGQVLVAFGAESGDAGSSASAACSTTKNVDLVVYNDVVAPTSASTPSDNEVVILSRDGDRAVPKATKAAVAGAILDRVEAEIRSR